ncbi:MAG TPA: DUF2142 domain-containing protein [Thermoleophilaceae bacterium]
MPAPLALLLAVVALFCLAWVLIVPAGQVPDEEMHLQYALTLAERGELPGHGPNGFSTQQWTAEVATNWERMPGAPERKPPWTNGEYEKWKAADAALPPGSKSNGGGYIWQGDNPPLYYGYEAAAYHASPGRGFFDRLYFMRVMSALWVLVTATGAWLLAGEIFGRDRPLQLVAAGFAGLLPMVDFVSSGVNPDAMLYAFWSVAFWLGARILRRGLTVRDGVALCALVGVAFAEKSTSIALIPPMLLALAVGWRRLSRTRPQARRVATVAVLVSLAAFAVPAGAWVVTAKALDRPITNRAPHYVGKPAPQLTSIQTDRQFLSYVWQFYLPRLPFMQPIPLLGSGGDKLYRVWVSQVWGNFGWQEVNFPPWAYKGFAALSVLLLAGGAAAALRARRRGHFDLAIAAYFALAIVSLLFLLHWAEYTIMSLEGIAFNQGRYLLPLVALGGVVVAACVSLLRPSLRTPATGVVLGSLVVLQLFSLGLVVERYFV